MSNLCPDACARVLIHTSRGHTGLLTVPIRQCRPIEPVNCVLTLLIYTSEQFLWFTIQSCVGRGSQAMHPCWSYRGILAISFALM